MYRYNTLTFADKNATCHSFILFLRLLLFCVHVSDGYASMYNT
jgi:hypothetical protein